MNEEITRSTILPPSLLTFRSNVKFIEKEISKRL